MLRVGLVFCIFSAFACARPEPIDPDARPSEPLIHWQVRRGTGAWLPLEPDHMPALAKPEREAWFRITLPVGSWPDPAVFLEGVDDVFDATIDGRPVYHWGDPDRPFDQRLGSAWHLIRIRPEDEGRVLSLHARAISDFDLGPSHRMEIGARGELVRAIVFRDAPSLLAALFSFFAAALALIVFVRRSDDTPYAAFAAYALFHGIVLLALTQMKQLLWNAPLAWSEALMVGRLFAPVAFLAFVDQLFAGQMRWLNRIWKIALGLTVIAAVAGLASYSNVYPLLWRPLNLEFLAGQAISLGALLWYARRHRGGAVLAAAQLVHFGFACVQWLFAAHLLSGAGLFEATGYLILLGVMGALALNRFVQVHQTLRAHAAALEQANALLAEKETALEGALRVRDDFISVASHELRTPLTAISLQAQMLDRRLGADDERLLQGIELIRWQTERLGELANRLLDVSQLRSGKIVLDVTEVDLAEVARHAIERIRNEAARAEVRLELDAPRSVVGRWDRGRLDQVVTNLLSNALKYGGQQPVTLSVSDGGPSGVLRVQDRGIGIARVDHQRIFERFERAVSHQHYSGLGLGLWISREIVEALGGKIAVQSEPGAGATFEVVLPKGEISRA